MNVTNNIGYPGSAIDGKIEFNTGIVNDEAQKLKKRENELISYRVKCPTFVGGGKTVNELNELGQAFETISKEIGNLLKASEAMLKKIGIEVAEVDTLMAAMFQQSQ